MNRDTGAISPYEKNGAAGQRSALHRNATCAGAARAHAAADVFNFDRTQFMHLFDHPSLRRALRAHFVFSLGIETA
jgi:hypothetical protein